MQIEAGHVNSITKILIRQRQELLSYHAKSSCGGALRFRPLKPRRLITKPLRSMLPQISGSRASTGNDVSGIIL